jgi:hypothetical protein
MGWGNPDQLALGNLNRGGVKLRSYTVQPTFPQAPETYPGLLQGIADLLGGRAAVRTILDWRDAKLRWGRIDVLQEALREKVAR